MPPPLHTNTSIILVCCPTAYTKGDSIVTVGFGQVVGMLELGKGKEMCKRGGKQEGAYYIYYTPV